MKGAWYYLPWWSVVPIRVRSRVAVRGERRHHALAFSSAAWGFVTVARAARFDWAVAGGRVEFGSAVTRAAFADLFYVVQKPCGGVLGAVHGPDLVAQLDGVADDVSRKWRGCLERKIESESQGGLRAADVLQGLVGRGRQNEDGVPRGRREIPVVAP